MRIHHLLPIALMAGLPAFLAAPALADPTVTVNGAPVTLSPAPTERGGRVFVPLRGVFERLGASVVYDSGTINATGNGRTISLRVGSTDASINGQPQVLDVAPFIIGASTYVPLRFVAQALGATVNYDQANQLVAIAMTSPTPPPAPVPERQAPPPPPERSHLRLGNLQPQNGGYVGSVRPTIEGLFADGSADPNSLRIALDGLDITASTTRSPNGFVYSPPSDLLSQPHQVRVIGRDEHGARFDLAWTFTSGSEQIRNSIRELRPNNGEAVSNTFTVSGRTLPNSALTIDAGAEVVIGGVVAFGGDHLRIETNADGNGYFSREVRLNAGSGQVVTLVVTSTEPRTKSSVRERRQFPIR